MEYLFEEKISLFAIETSLIPWNYAMPIRFGSGSSDNWMPPGRGKLSGTEFQSLNDSPLADSVTDSASWLQGDGAASENIITVLLSVSCFEHKKVVFLWRSMSYKQKVIAIIIRCMM